MNPSTKPSLKFASTCRTKRNDPQISQQSNRGGFRLIPLVSMVQSFKKKASFERRRKKNNTSGLPLFEKFETLRLMARRANPVIELFYYDGRRLEHTESNNVNHTIRQLA